jgi:hypothetical protein
MIETVSNRIVPACDPTPILTFPLKGKGLFVRRDTL